MLNKILTSLAAFSILTIHTTQAAAPAAGRSLHPAIERCLEREKRNCCTRFMDCRYSQLRLAHTQDKLCFFALDKEPALIVFTGCEGIFENPIIRNDFNPPVMLHGLNGTLLTASLESGADRAERAAYDEMIKNIITAGIITRDELKILLQQVHMNLMMTLRHPHSFYAQDYQNFLLERVCIDNFDPDEDINYYDHFGRWASKTVLTPTALNIYFNKLVDTVVKELLPLLTVSSKELDVWDKVNIETASTSVATTPDHPSTHCKADGSDVDTGTMRRRMQRALPFHDPLDE